jgi:hypothetical protein
VNSSRGESTKIRTSKVLAAAQHWLETGQPAAFTQQQQQQQLVVMQIC